MARTALTPVNIDQDGFDTASWFPDAANVDGNSWANTGIEMLYIRNTGISVRNVTIQTPKQTPDGLDVEERVIAVNPSDRMIVGPLLPRIYNRPRGSTDPGHVYIDYDSQADLQVGVLRPVYH